MFGVVVLSESHVEGLRATESETPLTPGPACKIPLITEKGAVQKGHQGAGVLPHFSTQLLASQVFRIMSHHSTVLLCRFV